MKIFSGWLVHAYTASSTILGLLTIEAIAAGRYVEALWWMAATVAVDGTDGTLARRFKVSETIPKIDGALLDNLVDYINYVVTPCFFLLMAPLLDQSMKWVVVSAVAMSSAYQFAQTDAKTEDHFFKGFPCYWNIVVFYLFIMKSDPMFNAVLLIGLSILVFVPVKYVYPSRMDYVSKSRWPRRLLFIASAAFCGCCLWLLWIYPLVNDLALAYSLLFAVVYIVVSLYRTVNPIQIVKRFSN